MNTQAEYRCIYGIDCVRHDSFLVQVTVTNTERFVTITFPDDNFETEGATSMRIELYSDKYSDVYVRDVYVTICSGKTPAYFRTPAQLCHCVPRKPALVTIFAGQVKVDCSLHHSAVYDRTASWFLCTG